MMASALKRRGSENGPGHRFPDARAAFPLPGLAAHGRKTGEACHLFAVERACFGVRCARMAFRWMVISAERPERKRRAGEQDCGGTDRTEAGNGSDDLEGAGLGFFGTDTGADFAVDVAQLSFDQRQASAALLDHKADLPGLDAVRKGGSDP